MNKIKKNVIILIIFLKEDGVKMLDALYIHIPFCLKKCSYCDFHSFEGKIKEEEKYVDYLIKELSLYPEYEFETIYFGGGTPSLLKAKSLYKILKKLKLKENAEITLELNPATSDYKKLKELKELGINRLSIGVQSFNNKTLDILGRKHSVAKAKEIYFQAREIGFDNISLDLMFATPNQSLLDLKKDLDEIICLNPEHISIYSLIWEEDTLFWDLKEKGILSPCDNDLEASMFELIISTLENNNYEHYEISNFSKRNYEARHNKKYWENKEYLALGLGASFYRNKHRGKNVISFDEYYSKIDLGEKPILEKEKIENSLIYKNILGLRLLKQGILVNGNDKNTLKICKKLLKEGFLIEKNTNNFTLSKKGLFFANDVFESFIE